MFQLFPYSPSDSSLVPPCMRKLSRLFYYWSSMLPCWWFQLNTRHLSPKHPPANCMLWACSCIFSVYIIAFLIYFVSLRNTNFYFCRFVDIALSRKNLILQYYQNYRSIWQMKTTGETLILLFFIIDFNAPKLFGSPFCVCSTLCIVINNRTFLVYKLMVVSIQY